MRSFKLRLLSGLGIGLINDERKKSQKKKDPIPIFKFTRNFFIDLGHIFF